MPSTTAESITWEAERAELQAVLQSPLFARSPTLSHLLSYLCEKTFAGETEQIKEYSVALDVFDRHDTFDQDTDSIVRVQANRLRKRLSQYYTGQGADHPIHITIPVGQYVPTFQHEATADVYVSKTDGAEERSSARPRGIRAPGTIWLIGAAIFLVIGLVAISFFTHRNVKPQPALYSSSQPSSEQAVGLPVGEEVHILAGSNRKYVDHAGKVWSPDSYFSGGSAAASAVQHIWRTQDPILYRNSRQGDFAYNIPLKPGTYELHLHFAETFYGPENSVGGGEGSRTMTVTANGQTLLRDFDVLADAGDGRTAEVKVFPDISPAADGATSSEFHFREERQRHGVGDRDPARSAGPCASGADRSARRSLLLERQPVVESRHVFQRRATQQQPGGARWGRTILSFMRRNDGDISRMRFLWRRAGTR